jgi:CBS domain-containing protein
MKVHEVMTNGAGFCRLEDNLTKAAEIMWQKDCGVVPVVDEADRVVGVITDRDIAIAAASRDRPPAQIKAHEMYLREPVACGPEDDIKDALRRMRKRKVRRLVVAGENMELIGIVSLSDILLKAGDKKSVRKLLFSTFKALSKPAPIVLREESETTEATETSEMIDNPTPS